MEQKSFSVIFTVVKNSEHLEDRKWVNFIRYLKMPLYRVMTEPWLVDLTFLVLFWLLWQVIDMNSHKRLLVCIIRIWCLFLSFTSFLTYWMNHSYARSISRSKKMQDSIKFFSEIQTIAQDFEIKLSVSSIFKNRAKFYKIGWILPYIFL